MSCKRWIYGNLLLGYHFESIYRLALWVKLLADDILKYFYQYVVCWISHVCGKGYSDFKRCILEETVYDILHCYIGKAKFVKMKLTKKFLVPCSLSAFRYLLILCTNIMLQFTFKNMALSLDKKKFSTTTCMFSTH